MDQAQRLLRESSVTTSEVGRRVGYQGFASFSRALPAQLRATHFGRSPRDIAFGLERAP